MEIYDFEQRSEEWYQIRSGIPTSSNFDKIVTTKGEPSKSAIKYMYQLAGQKVSGIAEDGFQSNAMLKGIELEAEARQLYEMTTNEEVKEVGFCLSNDGYGASPDALVGEKGLLEIKCPNVATHVEYLLKGTLPSTYFQQVQGQLLVTGREWCDFVSYSPGIKPFILRVLPDAKFQMSLKIELKMFCEKLNEVIRKIS